MADGKAGDIMRYSFLTVFANDGTIDAEELEFMKALALRDGRVDEAEAKVLSGIFGRVTEATVEPSVWADMELFKEAFGIE